jgi:hypothetical protein
MKSNFILDELGHGVQACGARFARSRAAKAAYRPSGWIATSCAAVMLALTVDTASADPPHGPRGGFEHPRPGWDHVDGRYGHNHYYPGRGYVVHEVPRDRFAVRGGFYYSGGVWYSHRGPGFVVVGAPVGVFVPVLPAYYTTVWFGGAPYYYANDTYYRWVPAENQYEVVAPPGDEGAAQTEPPGAPPPPGVAGPPANGPGGDMFIYPKNGQSEDQQATDKFECHQWAKQQSGFDPTQSGGGVSADQNASSHASYNRAMTACLDGRGYSVK